VLVWLVTTRTSCFQGRQRLKLNRLRFGTCVLGLSLIPLASYAHDPVFGLGPHTLFKGGFEFHAGALRKKAGEDSENEYAVAVNYGITSDWTVGIEAPYSDLNSPGASVSGRGDIGLSTKYRFWRNDQLGVQESAAASLATVLDTAGDDQVGNNATDVIAGLTYGYEGRKWYRWTALRYRRNGEGDAGFERGDKVLFDLVGGIRFSPTTYLEPDWVWMLELNGEYTQRARMNGASVADSGGSEWFISPGLMWTYRNVAVKTGVQLPIIHDLNGAQQNTDYRATLELELHY